MAANADELSREALWNAFTSRRCYTTTGSRILLDVSVAGVEMGGEVQVEEGVNVIVTVHGTAPIHRVDLTEGRDPLEFIWSGARSKTRHKVQDWSGGLSVDRSRVRDVEEIGFDHPAQGVKDVSDTAIRWEGKTAGNFQGVRVQIDDFAATVDVSTSPLSTSIPQEDIDDRRVFDAGLVERQVGVRRVGTSSTLDFEHTFKDSAVNNETHSYYVRVTPADGEML